MNHNTNNQFCEGTKALWLRPDFQGKYILVTLNHRFI